MDYISKEENIYIDVFTHENIAFHSHEFFELAYVLKGEGIHIQNDKSTKISEGDYFIVDYNTFHAYKCTDGSLIIANCLFLPDFIDRSLKGCRNFIEVLNNYLIRFSYDFSDKKPTDFVFCDEDGTIKKLINELLSEYKEKRSGYLEFMRCDIIQLIIRTMRKIYFKDVNISYNNYSKYVIKYINKNYNEHIKLTNLANTLHLSLPYLSKLFKDDTGVSFSEYLQKTRIEQSCRLLANTNKKIIEIAQLVGYNDVNFFNQIFKKQLGITPRCFKNVNKK